MKYRIKNPETEKAIRVLFKTEEIYQSVLDDTCDKHFHNYFRVIVIEGKPTQTKMGLQFSIGIAKTLIEEVVEYDPKVWNEYPKVTPPKDDYYRVQMTLPNFEVERFMLEWRDGKWRVNYLPEHRELLFKPWDDEENKE